MPDYEDIPGDVSHKSTEFDRPLGLAVFGDAEISVGVIGYVSATVSGNTVVKVGRSTPDGWEAIAHIVLNPHETQLLVDAATKAKGPHNE